MNRIIKSLLAGFLLFPTLALLSACERSEPELPRAEEPPLAEDIFAPLGAVIPFATEEQRADFQRGLELAQKRFTPEEGLGPRFNVDSCASCHLTPVVGGVAGRYRNFFIVGRTLEDGTFLMGPREGIVHSHGIEPFAPPRPPLDDSINTIAQRSPIPLFGMGLIAEIYEESILENADPFDESGNGISGRPNWDRGFVGRFGRKAQTVNVEGFIRGPIFNHMGITTDPLPPELLDSLPVPSGADAIATSSELRTLRQAQAAPPSEPLEDDDLVPDPELSAEDLFALVSFSMLLAAPQPSEPTELSLRGEEVFHEIRCAECHIPALQSPRGMIPLYSDLLLHDMGPELADGIAMGLATGSEFRTQPLWGVAAAGPWLHDGRADTLEEAILWHGGEGQASRNLYAELSTEEQKALLAFLHSLGGAEALTDGSILAGDLPPEPGELGGPRPGLTTEELDLWLAGRDLFDRNARYSEGLGDPHFNSDSCRSCHLAGEIGGAGPLDVSVVRAGTWLEDDDFVAPRDGTILPHIVAPGHRRREAPPGANTFEFRASPPLFGLGLLEEIDEEVLLERHDPDDLRGDGIRGRLSYLPDGRVGRFGWKGDVPSLREFVRDALTNELGQTVPDEEGHSFGALPEPGAEAETNSSQINALSFFLENLAAPPRQGDHPRGEELFHEIGCAECHIPELPGPNGPIPLYSDLLLHDIAPPDYRGIPSATASGREFRTPPLWGLRHSAPYMHDGLSSTIDDAIRRHRSTAEFARERYLNLSNSDLEALLQFLETL